jgi:hypothetical protein
MCASIYTMFRLGNLRLFLVSFFIYLFVNMFENLFHYNIGRHSDSALVFDMPTEKDWIKIVSVMITFAFLQGALTCYFDKGCM